MLIEKTTGTIFKNRLDAKKVMGSSRYFDLVKEGRIEFIKLDPFEED